MNNNKFIYKYKDLITENIETKLQNFRLGSLKKGNFLDVQLYKISLPSLSSYQKEAIFGPILGDASLQKNKHTRLKFDYSKKHEAYTNHVAEVLRRWILSLLAERQRKNVDYVGLGFQTLTHKHFDFFMLYL